MIKFSDINETKKAVIFELDNVLIPEKDYDLQVYYLFANFIEYLETFPPSKDVVAFMSMRYEAYGNDKMFEAVSDAFGIDYKYKENLDLLFLNAKLPLKLLLYQESVALLQEIIINRKKIFILTSGHPQQQLNKITQTEWQGLDKYLKVYFADEFAPKPAIAGLEYLLDDAKLQSEDVVFVGNSIADKTMTKAANIDYISL